MKLGGKQPEKCESGVKLSSQGKGGKTEEKLKETPVTSICSPGGVI
jgi:hypothetical protein